MSKKVRNYTVEFKRQIVGLVYKSFLNRSIKFSKIFIYYINKGNEFENKIINKLITYWVSDVLLTIKAVL